MLNMSNVFYNYLAEILSKHFELKDFLGGDRLCLRMDSPENVVAINDALKDKNKERLETFEAKEYEYKSYKLSFKNRSNPFDVVVVPKINLTDDFMTTMRNYPLKSREKGDANDEIMLMIADNPIDSIISGTADLQKKGEPLYIENFIEQLRDDIESSSNDLPQNIKSLIDFILENRALDNDSEDSIYDYAKIGRAHV